MSEQQVELTVIRVKVPNKWMIEAAKTFAPEDGIQRIRVKDRRLFRVGDRLLCRNIEPELWELVQAEPTTRTRLRLQAEEGISGEEEHTSCGPTGGVDEKGAREDSASPSDAGAEAKAGTEGRDAGRGLLRRLGAAIKDGLTKKQVAGSTPAPALKENPASPDTATPRREYAERSAGE